MYKAHLTHWHGGRLPKAVAVKTLKGTVVICMMYCKCIQTTTIIQIVPFFPREYGLKFLFQAMTACLCTSLLNHGLCLLDRPFHSERCTQHDR